MESAAMGGERERRWDGRGGGERKRRVDFGVLLWSPSLFPPPRPIARNFSPACPFSLLPLFRLLLRPSKKSILPSPLRFRTLDCYDAHSLNRRQSHLPFFLPSAPPPYRKVVTFLHPSLPPPFSLRAKSIFVVHLRCCCVLTRGSPSASASSSSSAASFLCPARALPSDRRSVFGRPAKKRGKRSKDAARLFSPTSDAGLFLFLFLRTLTPSKFAGVPPFGRWEGATGEGRRGKEEEERCALLYPLPLPSLGREDEERARGKSRKRRRCSKLCTGGRRERNWRRRRRFLRSRALFGGADISLLRCRRSQVTLLQVIRPIHNNRQIFPSGSEESLCQPSVGGRTSPFLRSCKEHPTPIEVRIEKIPKILAIHFHSCSEEMSCVRALYRL